MHSVRRLAPRLSAALGAVALLACDPASTRPQLAPTPESLSTEMRAAAPKAIETLARALQADSIPVRRIEARDGWLDSGWYHLATGAPAAARAAGDDVVRVRAWAEPSRNKFVLLYVQAERRSRFDPSLPEGDLAVALKADHPLAKTVTDILNSLGERPGIREAAPEPADPSPPRRP
jgi:hypothetical protein